MPSSPVYKHEPWPPRSRKGRHEAGPEGRADFTAVRDRRAGKSFFGYPYLTSRCCGILGILHDPVINLASRSTDPNDQDYVSGSQVCTSRLHVLAFSGTESNPKS